MNIKQHNILNIHKCIRWIAGEKEASERDETVEKRRCDRELDRKKITRKATAGRKGEYEEKNGNQDLSFSFCKFFVLVFVKI